MLLRYALIAYKVAKTCLRRGLIAFEVYYVYPRCLKCALGDNEVAEVDLRLLKYFFISFMA
jgi:hypothetical protein